MAKVKREFYELPTGNTSTEIVNAARLSLRSTATSRPYTPQKKSRTLYPNRPGSSNSSVDITDIKAAPRTLSPISQKEEKEKETDNENFGAYWKAKIAPILGSLAMNLENVNILKQVDMLCDALLRGGFLTGSVALPQSYRVKVFQCLIGHLDKQDTKLLLKISRILLCLGVYEKNLVSISKLIFKLTRCEENDSYFLEEKIVHCLLNTLNRYDLEENHKAFVYCIGAIRVLSAHPDNNVGDILVQYGILQVLERHLQTCNTSKVLSLEDKGNLLIQIVGTFRNLCDIPATEKMIDVPALCYNLEHIIVNHYSTNEVLLVCYRLLSRISMFSLACPVIASNTSLMNILSRTMNSSLHNTALLLRCCFVLGNVTSRNEPAVLHLHHNGDILETVVSVCEAYKGKLCEKQTKDKQVIYKDVLCKVVRVATNLLQHKEVSTSISPRLIKILLVLGHMAMQSNHYELLLHVLCCFNNVSYHDSCKGTIFGKHRKVILDFLLSAITVDNINVTIEVISVLANLSRQMDVVDRLISDKNLIEIFTTTLESENSDLVYKTVGLLTNITSNYNTHSVFNEKLVYLCTELLCDVGMLDTDLSTVTSYLLWNIISIGTIDITQENKDKILNIMHHYVDEEYCNNSHWIERFHPVAKKLIAHLDEECQFSPL